MDESEDRHARSVGHWHRVKLATFVSESGRPYALEMVARVNGEEWSRGSSAIMHHRFEDVVAFVSRSEFVR